MNCIRCGAPNAGEGGVCAECGSRLSTSSQEPATTPGRSGRSARGASLTFAPGEAFGGRYTIVEEVGSGGMGQVYKAIDNRLDKTVAIKLVRPDIAARGHALGRFRRELGLAQEVSHPNVCRVHDMGEVEGIQYISMEFIEGQTLEDLIHSVGRLSPRQAAGLGRQICAGLAAVHERGIVHRDLKPGNVMLDRSGRAVVMDFGMAYQPASDPITAEGAVLGTLAYLPPEQARGDPTDQRSDVYSVGLILYEMMAGRRPPGDGIAVPLALRDSAQACPPPSRFEPEVPPVLDAVVMRCLEREPERRFSSAAELAAALERVTAGLSSGASLARAAPAVGRLNFRRRRRPLILGGIAVILGVVVWRFPPGPGPPALESRPVVAVLPLAAVGGDPADDYLGVGIADSLLTRLAGLASVTVVSRAATLEYRGRVPRARSVARDLGVNFVVQGGVQRLGQRLRVTLNLVRPDDSVAWGRAYEGALDELFPLQARLAEDLSGALALTLTQADRRHLARAPTADAAAFADYARGRALLERPDVPENVSRAIDAFRAAIAKDPKFALAHAGLGQAYWQQYQETREPAWTGQAVGSITEALRLEPDQTATRVALALVYRGTGRADAAAEELRHALLLQPSSDDAHRLLGEILAEQGRTEEAVAELGKAIELRPNYWGNHASLGRILVQTARYPEAAAAFRRVTELQPDNSRGFQMLGTAYHAWGKTDLALENYQRAIALGPDARAFTNIGNIHYAEGRFVDAARAFEEAARLEPSSPTKQGNLGDAYTRLGQASKARGAYLRGVELAEAILRVNPKDARTLGLLALYEAKLRRRDEAARHAAQAAALAPDDGEALYSQAVVHALVGETRPALACLEKALAKGYSVALARGDEDLAALRKMPAFEKLVARSR